MISKEQITTLIEQKITGTDLFLVEATVNTSNKISISIDKFNGNVAINECVQLSRYIEANLNREEEDFSLEVSSAGMDIPFKVHNQYLKNIGREVEIQTIDSVKYEGKLLKVTPTDVELEVILRDKKTKKENIELVLLPFLQIKTTKKIISFK